MLYTNLRYLQFKCSLRVSFYIHEFILVVRNITLLNLKLTGVSLRWDGDSYLEVGASPEYRGILCGLCGNFNSFKRDDVIGGDGSLERNDIDFAESWRASNNIFDCTRPNYDAK